jgi:pimeloyl-ACP methyl ester carboxylesterase
MDTGVIMDHEEVKQSFLEIEGNKIAYLESGVGETVLLVHGITTYSFIWRDIITILSTKYNVVAIDLLGCGDSDKPLDKSYSLTNHAITIYNFVKAKGLKKIHFVGHDLGGGIAQIFAVNYSEMLYDFSVLNSVAYDFWPVQPIVAIRTPIIRQFAMATLDLGVFEIIVRRGVYNKAIDDDSLMKLFWKPMLTQEGRKGFLHFAECLNNKNLTDISDKLHANNLPMLIVRGDSDLYLSSEISEKLHKNISTSKLVIVPKAGHFIQLDKPALVSNLLIDFFNANGNDRT